MRYLGGSDFDPTPFSPLEQDALELTLQMTRAIQVDPVLMKRLQEALGNTALVELVTVIAAYNMVSRFLIALDIHPEDQAPKA
jgi:alkylhydroperoxidase family enzyme